MDKFTSEEALSSGRPSGTYVSTKCGFGLVLLAVLIAVVVGLIVNFAVTKEVNVTCKVEEVAAAPGVTSGQVQQCIDNCKSGQSCIVATTLAPPALSTQMTSATTPTPEPTPSGNPNMRLPKSLVPYHYDVELRPDIYKTDPKDFTSTGNVTVYFRCVESTSVITLHSNKLVISSYSLTHADGTTGSPTILTNAYDAVTQFQKFNTSSPLTQGRNYSLALHFDGPMKADLAGLYYSSYEVGNGELPRYIATTQMEPTDARKAFPCFDEPAMKATFSVKLWRQRHMVALSNMPVSTNQTESNGWVVDTFQKTPPMSTYLIAFIVCDFKSVEMQTKKGTIVRVWAREASMNQTTYALHAGKNITEYFESYFGVDYPLPKQDMIAIPDFAAGAMENWGLITYRETALLYDPNFASASNKQRVAVVVSHELAHQWFGDLVSPQWWDDLWLNEGFASYVEYIGVNYIEPDWEMMTQILYEDVFSVKVEDSLATSHPVYVPVNDPEEINEIFDSISYAKGASIIRMIKFCIGDSVFQRGLQNYLSGRAYQNAAKEDLWDAWEMEAKQQNVSIKVADIMNSWTNQMGYPVIKVEYKDAKTYVATQTRFVVDKTKPADPRYNSTYNYKWHVPITYTTDKSPNFDQSTGDIKWMTPTSGELQLDLNVNTFNTWFIVNVGSYGFYRVNYEPAMWDKLIAQLVIDHMVINENNRGQLIDDAFALAKAGDIEIEKAMGTTEYLAKETKYVPMLTALGGLSDIDTLLEKSTAYGNFETYMKQLVTSLYDNVGGFNDTASKHIDQLRRVPIVARACSYDIGDCRANAKQAFVAWRTNNIQVSTNLRSTVYCNGVRLGGKEEWEFVYEMFKNQTSVATESIKLLNALSCTQQLWLLNRMLNYSLDSSKIRKQDAVSAIVYVSNNPLGKYLAWNFVRQNWDRMYTEFGGGSFSFSNLITGVMRTFNTEYELSEALEFGRVNADKLGSASRAYNQAIERIQNNIKFLAANEDKLSKWLASHV